MNRNQKIARSRDRERGTLWARSLASHDRSEFITQNVLDDFDWTDWFEYKPTSAFINAAFREAQFLEEMSGVA